MAVKLEIHEICRKCGSIAARQESDGTVHINAHNCPKAPPGPPDYPRSFRSREVIFVPAQESNNIVKLILANRELQAKNSRLSSNFKEMAKDCARLQKILLDIGHKVCDVLGIDIVQKTISPCTGMWQCDCDIWNAKYLHSCCNCGRSKQC